jgi:hypothetical protein
MATYTPFHADWKDFPDTSTPITAAALEYIEAELVRAAAAEGGGSATDLGWFNAKSATYGAVGDGVTNDTAALQACLTAAFNSPGGTMYLPPGTYVVTSALTIPTGSGAVRILGAGRPYPGPVASFSIAEQGTTIKTTSTTADVFTFTATSSRQAVTIESLTVKGNVATGTTGHGIQFVATGSAGIIVTMRDVEVIGAKQHGIYFNGAIFEGQLFACRAERCGSAGFKAALNSAGIPGETRFFGGSYDNNDVGIDLAGGGAWSLHGTTCSFNTHEGIKANGVYFRGYELQIEANGTSSGNSATFTSCSAAIIVGAQCGPIAGCTGIGLAFVSCVACKIESYIGNGSAAGIGYVDFSFATSSRCTAENYVSADSVDRFALGSGGGHLVHRGSSWQTSQNVAQQVISSSTTGTDTFDATKYDSFMSTRTASGITRNIAFPNPFSDAYNAGQRVAIHIYNNSAGATTTSWDGLFHLAGAWVDPAAGKTRAIWFEYNGTRGGYWELGRSAADIT